MNLTILCERYLMKLLEIREIKKDNLYEIYIAHKKLAQLILQKNIYHLYFYKQDQEIKLYQFIDLLDAKTFLSQHLVNKESLCQGIAERERAKYQKEASTSESLKRQDSEYYLIRSKNTWIIRDDTIKEDVGVVYRGKYARDYVVKMNNISILVAHDLDAVINKVNVLFNNPDQLAFMIYEYWLTRCRYYLEDISDWIYPN